MVIFAGSLPTIRRRVDIDLAKPGLPREKVLAAVVRLMERTLARVGNSEYVRENVVPSQNLVREHLIRDRLMIPGEARASA